MKIETRPFAPKSIPAAPALARLILAAGIGMMLSQPASAEVVMEADDAAAGTTKVGSWTANVATPTSYDNGYRFATTAGGTADSMRFFSPRPITSTGTWCIQARWVTGTNRTTQALYQIYDGTTLRATFPANQTADGSAWRRLGCATHTAGRIAEVRLLDTGGAAGTVVVGDAVRWVWEEASVGADYCIAVNGGFGSPNFGTTFVAKGLGGRPASNTCKPFAGILRTGSTVMGATNGSICRSSDGTVITATLHTTAPEFLGAGSAVSDHIEYCPPGTVNCLARGGSSGSDTGQFSGTAAEAACTSAVTTIPSVHN